MSEGPYVLGIDLGTESVRVGIFDLEGTPAVFAAEAYSLKHLHSGWAEQDPDEWWSCLVKATRWALDEGRSAALPGPRATEKEDTWISNPGP